MAPGNRGSVQALLCLQCLAFALSSCSAFTPDPLFDGSLLLQTRGDLETDSQNPVHPMDEVAVNPKKLQTSEDEQAQLAEEDFEPGDVDNMAVDTALRSEGRECEGVECNMPDTLTADQEVAKPVAVSFLQEKPNPRLFLLLIHASGMCVGPGYGYTDDLRPGDDLVFARCLRSMRALPANDGYYVLQHVTGMCVGPDSRSPKLVLVSDCNVLNEALHVKVVPADGGYYALQNRNGMCLHPMTSGGNPGLNVKLVYRNGCDTSNHAILFRNVPFPAYESAPNESEPVDSQSADARRALNALETMAEASHPHTKGAAQQTHQPASHAQHHASTKAAPQHVQQQVVHAQPHGESARQPHEGDWLADEVSKAVTDSSLVEAAPKQDRAQSLQAQPASASAWDKVKSVFAPLAHSAQQATAKLAHGPSDAIKASEAALEAIAKAKEAQALADAAAEAQAQAIKAVEESAARILKLKPELKFQVLEGQDPNSLLAEALHTRSLGFSDCIPENITLTNREGEPLDPNIKPTARHYPVTFKVPLVDQVEEHYTLFGIGLCSEDELDYRIGGWNYNTTKQHAMEACSSVSCRGFHWNIKGQSFVLVSKVGPKLGPDTVKGEMCYSKEKPGAVMGPAKLLQEAQNLEMPANLIPWK